MCDALMELMKDELEDARNSGRDEGRSEGRNEGIRTLVETCRDLGVSKENTVFQLMTRYSLSQDAAQKSVNSYWK